MICKSDTKEKFHAITLCGPSLTATMADELVLSIESYLQKEIKNIIVILQNIESVDNVAFEKLCLLQSTFMEQQVSLVFCDLPTPVKEKFEQQGLLEKLNYAPTESEAWDIVQMEEIERELMLGDDE